eukprot:TRINITY_DN4367_c0_g2_i1.p1 TRINITY_DN4367_c0_g2~~TRINITY_DN4367_c0_g2_i1.p1  ORF type:complete len:351 (+),score=51.43 TRINITY_DN4367_c0_g2_i1:54-1106(+)
MPVFENITQTVGNTPVVKLQRMSPKGVDVYVKLEAFNPMGSVKDRLALGIIEDAERQGKLKPGMTVCEATSGNTGIGLAMVCAQKGYPLVVVMSEGASKERRKIMRFLGARVVITPSKLKCSGMVKKAAELAAAHGYFLTQQFVNDANPEIHRQTTAKEILSDFQSINKTLDYWVTGFGTGGTFSGVSSVLKKESPTTKICLVEPDTAKMVASGVPQEVDSNGVPVKSHPCHESSPIEGWTPDWIGKITNEASKNVDIFETCTGPEAMLCSRELACKEGIFCGISSGATLHAGLKIAATAPEGSTFLVMLPDTGERYLTTPLFSDIEVDMNEAERELSLSTPSSQLDETS